MRHWIDLTDAELASLGTVTEPQAQVVIDAAIARLAMAAGRPDLPLHLTDLAADIVFRARSQKILTATPTSRRKCDACGADAGYHPYSRNGRHRPGTPNLKRPKSLQMFNSHGVVCCTACWFIVLPIALETLKDDEIEIAKALTGVESPYKRYQNQKCMHCSFVGVATAFERSYYTPFRAKCPKCGEDYLQSTGTYAIVNVHAEAAHDALARMANEPS